MMIIINFLLFMLAGVGITNLVVNATILEGFRQYMGSKSLFLNKLLTCMTCSGFWVGLVLSFSFSINPIVAAATISLLSTKFSYFIEYIETVIALKAKQLETLVKKDEDVD